MAEYYPLIVRAVANLGASTLEDRMALYGRATHALLSQLQNASPPVAAEEIARERLALEAAIRRVETEIAGAVVPTMMAQPLPAATVPGPPRESAQAWLRRSVLETPAATPASISGAIPGADLWMPDAGDEPGEADDAERGGSAASGVERPRVPLPPTRRAERSWTRALVIAVAAAVVVGLTAVAAIMLKHEPSDFDTTPAAGGKTTEADGKVQDRLPGDAAAGAQPGPPLLAGGGPPAAPGAASPVQPLSPGPAGANTAALGKPAAAPAASGQRAVLVEQAPDGSQETKPLIGRVAWRLDNVSNGPGEPLDAAIRADAEVPEAGLKLSLLFRKNRDAALPASHTVELAFVPAGEPNGPVRDVTGLEMRTEVLLRGPPLSGIAVPVKENLFLIGLSNLPSDVQLNLDLLRSRSWVALAYRYANGRRAVLLLEKGLVGERTVADALQAWQQ